MQFRKATCYFCTVVRGIAKMQTSARKKVGKKNTGWGEHSFLLLASGKRVVCSPGYRSSSPLKRNALGASRPTQEETDPEIPMALLLFACWFGTRDSPDRSGPRGAAFPQGTRRGRRLPPGGGVVPALRRALPPRPRGRAHPLGAVGRRRRLELLRWLRAECRRGGLRGRRAAVCAVAFRLYLPKLGNGWNSAWLSGAFPGTSSSAWQMFWGMTRESIRLPLCFLQDSAVLGRVRPRRCSLLCDLLCFCTSLPESTSSGSW